MEKNNPIKNQTLSTGLKNLKIEFDFLTIINGISLSQII
ncbi:hypothetical protein LEP1GSC196_2470 [Leptospira meyeri serovar Semaranga str. Veldrot Semarang 173]|nr:hypothetical protein LEP1GSC196_2470 [Leptospira meyeri serovar Semaranga str. Veldrot Semarang 173]